MSFDTITFYIMLLSIKEKIKMKVCFVLMSRFPDIESGVGNLVFELVKALSKEVTVQVVCMSVTSQKGSPDNVEIYPILKLPKIKLVGCLIGIPLNLALIYNFLRSNRPDIVHAQMVFENGFFSLPAKLLNIPIIITSHGVDIQIDRDIGYGLRQNRFMAKLIEIVLKYSSIHTVVSKHMVKDAIGAGSAPSKIRVIYNGIDISKIPSFGGTNVLQQCKIGEDDFVILYLGRLHPKKCPDDLVRAFPKVVKKVPNAKLIFAGEGEEETKLKGLASDLNLEDKVIFTGFVSEDEKWNVLRNCDVFVLPSVVEAFGITVIEAMACGKPVIATNVGPFSEIIRDGETGLLLPLHAPDELADAIIALALDENKRKQMGKKARKGVEERFDINKIANDYLEVYRELLSKSA
ncbi:Trehalose synthase [ANME-1 cluster archaeon GoMg2]|nr:Trehalose synthase [ANME-1 cluster archaeon GoMg2]